MWSRLGDLNPGPTHYTCVATSSSMGFLARSEDLITEHGERFRVKPHTSNRQRPRERSTNS